ncbi:MAG: TonB-dependent receptor plug domain-containing protein [Hyphomicrobium sp.]
MRIAVFFSLPVFGLLVFGGPAVAQQQTETPPPPEVSPAADAAAKPVGPAPSSSQVLPSLEVVATQPKKKSVVKKKPAQPVSATNAPAPSPAGPDAADRAGRSPSAVASELRDSTTGTSTISATDIARSGESTVYDVLRSMPNVTPAPSGPSIPAIRGEGATPTNLFSNFYQGTTSRIVLSVDDIPRISSYANNSFQTLYDVSSVQVLRGPQHTLPGANAFAGAYIVDTNDPVFSYSAGALTEFTYNEHSGTNYRNAAFVNVPLSNEAALRFVAEFDKGEIPVDIVAPAGVDVGKLDDYDSLNLRGKFLVEPDSIPGLSVLVSGEYGNGLDHVFNNYVDRTPFSDRERSANDFRINDTEGWAAGVRANYQLSAREEIASITSYVSDQYSSSPRSTSFYNFKDMVEERFAQDFTYSFRDVANLTGVIGISVTDGGRNYDVSAIVGPITAFAVTDADIATQAAYADIAWNFAGPFDLLFGGRIEHLNDKRSLVAGVPVPVPFVTPAFTNTYNYDVDEVYLLPKIGLRYNLGPKESVAFTVRKGYNPGGAYANLQAFFPVPFPYEEYKAEEVWTYEAAYRTAMMNNRLQLGVTAFYNDYKDKQFAITTQQVIRIFNEPDAESYGLEFEAKYAVAPDFDVMGSIGLLHTEIKDIAATTTAAILGNDFGQDPSYSLSLGVAWRPVKNLELTARGVYVDDYFTDFRNETLNVAGGYTLIDIGASYQLGNAEARVFVNNVTDETALYALQMNAIPRNATLLDPRTFGASLELKF